MVHNASGFYLKYKTVIIFKPLQNKYFNSFINTPEIKRWNNTYSDISNYKGNNKLSAKININTVSVFISDQIPAKGDIKYWTTFLNQDTAVFTGVGKIAAKYDMAVVFFNIQKIKRGHYNLDT